MKPDATHSVRLVPLIVGMALLMQSLNANVVANALPHIANSLKVPVLSLNVTITAYMLASVICLPVSGWIADRFGARRVFQWAIALYLGCSVLCALSQTLNQLVAARALQGAAGALLMPVGRLLMLKTVPKKDFVTALSYLTAPVLLGPALGPPLGGLIVTYLSWRWIFLFSVPVGILGVVLVTLFVPNVREDKPEKLDVPGLLLTGLGLAALVTTIQSMGRADASLTVVGFAAAIATVCFSLYAVHARRTPHAILDFTLLRYHTFRATLLGGHFLRMMGGATPFMLTLLLQVGFGFSAITAGLMTFSSAASAMLMKPSARPIIKRFGFRRVMVFNGVLTAASVMVCGLIDKTTPAAVIAALLFVGGFFRSLQFTALNALGFADIPDRLMSKATTLQSMAQPLAQSMGIAIVAEVLHRLQVQSGGLPLQAHQISLAFFLLGAGSLIGLPFLIGLKPDAGGDVSGHRVRSTAPTALENDGG